MNIVITGASKGIGFQVAKFFLNNNNNRIIALSKSLKGLESLKSEVENAQNLSIHKFDITKYEENELINICDAFDSIDILINNAGVLINKLFFDTTIQEWKDTFEVNLFSPVKIIKDLVPKMRLATQPHIINIGSMGGFQGSAKFKGLSAYSCSKAALANLTECLAVELKEEKIFVNCLCLGAVNTRMFREAFPEFTAPLESDEIAKFICEFAVQSRGIINGKILPISISTP